jgi:hypothetical protein
MYFVIYSTSSVAMVLLYLKCKPNTAKANEAYKIKDMTFIEHIPVDSTLYIRQVSCAGLHKKKYLHCP